MGWKATGQPTVRQQRDKWVVRVDGIDTETGRVRPRQIGYVCVSSVCHGGVSFGRGHRRRLGS